MAEIVGKTRPVGHRMKEIVKRVARYENSFLILILIVVVATIAVITKGKTISRLNFSNILSQISSRGIASVGQFFVILTAGIDLSVGGLAALTMCVGAELMSGKAGLAAMTMGIAVILLVGFGIGSANGLLVSRINIPPLIVTLSMWLISEAGTLQILGGRAILTNLPPSLAFFGQANVAGVPVSFIIFVAVVVVAYFILNHTTFGRSVYAVGGSPVSAWLSGINTRNIIFSVYAISGFLAALASLVVVARTMTASAEVIGPLEFDTITAVCIGGVSLAGGRGSLIGGVIGVIILGIISNGMNLMGIPIAFQSIVKGAIIITAVTIDTMRRR